MADVPRPSDPAADSQEIREENTQPNDPAKIIADVVPTISFAAYQNAVPIIRSLVIRNETGSTQYNLVLSLAASPAFVRPKRWHIDRLHAGQSLTIQDRDLELDPDFLRGLNEAERGELRLSLADASGELAAARCDLRVLARDEWGGMQHAGQLLAAFVMPNDPAIGRLQKSAASILSEHGQNSHLDGYQSGDPKHAFRQIAALWSAVTAEGLSYANPPSSFETHGQKTRPAERVLEEGLATCLDSTLLFAAAIEAVGLHPVIVFRDGHCFAGGWIREAKFSETLTTMPSEVRKAIRAHDLVVFETTLVTHQPPGRFEQAIREAHAQLGEDEEHSFVAALDIARARMAGVKPLASHGRTEPTPKPNEPRQAGPAPLAEPPDFEQLPEEVADEKPTTAAGRIERWQRKLLDLSLRNRLLNFKDSKQTIPIRCPDISALEDHLAAGKSFKIISAQQAQAVEGRDEQLHRLRTGDDLLQQFIERAWDHREVVSTLTERELSGRLTTLYRTARSDIAEGGSNTLYLAVGFLRWRQKPTDEKSYRAPLLLVPVKLTRRSALSAYKLSAHEDEVRFNATLIQLLKKDFHLDLTELESKLPTDDSGVDVPRILGRTRQLVRDVPGFEVVDELALGTFSFVKYLLWKDLVDRLAQLEQNPVVRHLIRDPDKVYREDDRTRMPTSQHIDTQFEPAELIHPLPADSSQLAAVMSAAQGHDFVLIGPPGTGKSQTIANMIAQCLAEQKTVLFVAEKTAALDVVHRRLCEHGLGKSCLELHSNKSERKQFLQQLKIAWESKSRPDEERWARINSDLKNRRDELNRYVAEMHQPDDSGWTVFRAMGRVVCDVAKEAPELNWPADVRHERDAYIQLVDTVRSLGVTFAGVEVSPHLRAIDQGDWSVRWEQELLDAAKHLHQQTTSFRDRLERLLEAIGMERSQVRTMDAIRSIVRLCRAVDDVATVDCRLLFDKQFSKLGEEFKRLESVLGDYRQTHERLLGQYDEAVIPDIPIKDLEAQWRDAVAKLWPLSWFGRRKVDRLLATYSAGGDPSAESDLAPLAQLQELLAELSETLLDGKTPLWQGTETDLNALREHLQRVDRIRREVVTFGQRFTNLEIVSRKLAPVLTDASGQHELLETARVLVEESEAWFLAINKFEKLCGTSVVDGLQQDLLSDLLGLTAGLEADRLKLRGWTAWCAIRSTARQQQLGAFVDALENGSLTPHEAEERFELAYARWWLPLAIDRSPLLRAFQGFRHEDAIREFRRLDDEARQCASQTVSHSARHQLPPASHVPRKSELGLLRHQMNLQRPSKSIREVIGGLPTTFSRLAPCVLMSPLSIAQYLPADHPPFDVVIFDEASQITTWDAIGAIARGQQTIVVGDPKQLPPTNFFGRSDNGDDSDGLDDFERDLESILDETKAAGLPVLDLKWHYRSRHESLIAFSNHRYYNDELITFPSADLVDCGVEFHHVADGIYDRGTSRTNMREAEAIVAEAVRRMRAGLELPEEERLTFGVVTFNQTQQTLIQDLFDQALREHPELEWYFSDDRFEPTVVKNLENVQGDERDVILFSITYGRDSAGTFYRNFGALNSVGGERRLNVAVTRARQLMIVYASFTADQLDINGLNSRGVIDLKHFLEFAEKGEDVLASQTEGSVGELESPFEEAVAEALRKKGWRVIPQVGVSKFRIDLGIVHPHRQGSFLAGIECDGATYHRSATARDRDKIREQVLRNLGWEIIRIWSPDWWYNQDGALDQVDTRLHGLLKESMRVDSAPSRSDAERDPADSGIDAVRNVAPSTTEATGSVTDTELHQAPEASNRAAAGSPSTSSEKSTLTYAASDDVSVLRERSPQTANEDRVEPASESTYYEPCDTSGWETSPEIFHHDHYTAELTTMLRELLNAEGPIHEDLVAQRIARAHGWTRTGRKIKQRVYEVLEVFPKTSESSGDFYWGDSGVQEIVSFRPPASDEDRRPLEQIALAEICGCLQANQALLYAEDIEAELGKALGYGRITANMRPRLREAIERTREQVGL